MKRLYLIISTVTLTGCASTVWINDRYPDEAVALQQYNYDRAKCEAYARRMVPIASPYIPDDSSYEVDGSIWHGYRQHTYHSTIQRVPSDNERWAAQMSAMNDLGDMFRRNTLEDGCMRDLGWYEVDKSVAYFMKNPLKPEPEPVTFYEDSNNSDTAVSKDDNEQNLLKDCQCVPFLEDKILFLQQNENVDERAVVTAAIGPLLLRRSCSVANKSIRNQASKKPAGQAFLWPDNICRQQVDKLRRQPQYENWFHGLPPIQMIRPELTLIFGKQKTQELISRAYK